MFYHITPSDGVSLGIRDDVGGPVPGPLVRRVPASAEPGHAHPREDVHRHHLVHLCPVW